MDILRQFINLRNCKTLLDYLRVNRQITLKLLVIFVFRHMTRFFILLVRFYLCRRIYFKYVYILSYLIFFGTVTIIMYLPSLFLWGRHPGDQVHRFYLNWYFFLLKVFFFIVSKEVLFDEHRTRYHDYYRSCCAIVQR